MHIDKYTLYGIRLLVFLEDTPQSNQYHQIILNQEQFKNISDSFVTIVDKNGNDELVKIEMSEKIYTLPDLQEMAIIS